MSVNQTIAKIHDLGQSLHEEEAPADWTAGSLPARRGFRGRGRMMVRQYRGATSAEAAMSCRQAACGPVRWRVTPQCVTAVVLIR